jgi:HlyD family secretion protein
MAEKGAVQLERQAGQLLVRASRSATVAALKVRAAGTVVNPGEPLMQLLPAGCGLLCEARVANRDVGHLKPGLPVKLKLDAFPMQKYGVVPGHVLKISPDAEPDAQAGYLYKLECSLDRQRLEGEGREVTLFPGPEAQVQVVTRQETLLELALRPLRELGESVSIED